MTVDHVRAALARWYGLVSRGTEPLDAIVAVSASDCRVHLKNGEVGPPSIGDPEILRLRAAYPALHIEVQHVMVLDDRLVAQIALDCPTPAWLPEVATPTLRSVGAFMARVDRGAELTETWWYFNPGAVLTFPSTEGSQSPAPPPLPPTGSFTTDADAEANARAVCATWARAVTVADLLDRVEESAAVDCLEHATNGERGRVELLEAQLRVIGRAMPDATVVFEPPAFESARFLLPFTLSGTQRGPLGPTPPTGLRRTSIGALAGRVDARGQVVEVWAYFTLGDGPAFGTAVPSAEGTTA